MKNSARKIIAWVLTLMMFLSSVPTSSLAGVLVVRNENVIIDVSNSISVAGDFFTSKVRSKDFSVVVSSEENILPKDGEVLFSKKAVQNNRSASAMTADESTELGRFDISIYDNMTKSLWEPEEGETVEVEVRLSQENYLPKSEGTTLHLYHYVGNTPVEIPAQFYTVNGAVSGFDFTTDGFSVYAVVETNDDFDPDARLYVHFMKGTTEIAEESITYSQLDKGMLNIQIYDPHFDLAKGEVFKGWKLGTATNGNYTVADAEDASVKMDIAGIRSMVQQELLDGKVKDGDELYFYAMIYKAYHVSYIDELKVTIYTDEVLYKEGDDPVNYDVQFTYTPYYVTGSDEEDETKAANFDGWCRVGTDFAELDPTDIWENGKTVNMAALTGLVNDTLLLKAQVSYGHWLVFDSNAADASYTAPLFVGTDETPADAGYNSIQNPERPGYDFVNWYADSELETVFDPDQAISKTTHVYADWSEKGTSRFSVLVWQEKVNGGWDFVRSITIPNVSTNYEMKNVINTVNNNDSQIIVKYGRTVNEQVSILFPAGHSDANQICRGFKYDHYDTNNNGKVVSNGTSVLNVYFVRRDYTLKFYYGRYYNNEWYIARNGTYSWVKASTGYTPAYIAGKLKTGSDTTGDGQRGTFYYAYIEAKYGQEIGSQWPEYGDFRDYTTSGSNANNDEYLNSWILMPGAKARTGENGGSTVKGKIITMDEQLIGNLAVSNAYVIGQYNSRPNEYVYHIYFKAPDGYQGTTATFNGTKYVLNEDIAVHSGSDFGDQHAPAYRGYNNVGKRDNHTTAGKYDREIWYFYDPISYPILFMDGVYVSDNTTVDKSGNTLRSLQGNDKIEYKADVSEFNSFDPTSLIPDGSRYVFMGWYSDSACTDKFTFETMPEGGITVYAKWILKKYKITLYPEAGNDTVQYDTTFTDEYLEHGKAIPNVGGTREGYTLIGWFANERLTKVWDFDAFVLNDTIVRKYGELYSAPEANGTVGEVNLYASWRKIIEGDIGISVVYTAEGKVDDNETPVTGDKAPVDPNKYLDKTQAIARPACEPPTVAEGEPKIAFQYWVVQKWDGKAYVDTDQKVFPGDRYTINYDDAKQVIINEVNGKVTEATYTIQLRAQYSLKDSEDKTHINWFDNYSNTIYKENPDLAINQMVDVANAPTRTGYTFLGWAKEKETDDSGNLIYTTSSTTLFISYSNGKYYRNGSLVKGVFADESKPYDGMYALWDENEVTINYAVASDCADMGTVSLATETIGVCTGTPAGSTASATEGYAFDYWTCDDGTESISTDAEFKPAKNSDGFYEAHTYYAHFKVATASVTVHHYLKDTTTKVADDVTDTATIGGSYTATAVSTYDGKALTVASYAPSQTVTVAAAGNEITIYYTLALTIEAATAGKEYDGKPLSGSYTVTGELSTDTATITSALGTAPSITNVAESPKNYLTEADQKKITGIPSYYVVTYTPGKLTITPKTVTLVSGSKTREYNGTALTNAEVEGKNANGLITETGWIEGEGATYSFTGTITEVGEKTNAFSYTLKAGTIKTNYTIEKTEGTLKIEQNTAAIVVTPGSGEQEYNGKALTKTAHDDFTVTGVPEGFTWTAAADGTVTNVKPGEGEKAVNAVTEFKIFNAKNEDVTDQFANIDKSATGKLEITPKTVTLASGSKTREYNGTALTNAEVEGRNDNGLITETGWIDGEGATYEFTGTITTEGNVKNAFDYTLKNNTIATNYDIGKTEGDLVIEKNTAKIVVTPGSASKEYDGKALTKTAHDDFTVTGVPEGFTWTAAADGTVTNVKPGEGEKAVNAVTEFKIFNAKYEDVTDQFANIDKSATGKLEITPKTVTLASGSKTREYNGTALTNAEVEGKNANGLTTETGWIEGEGATYTFSGTITTEGSVKNAFDYTLKSNTIATNYDITKTEGDLAIEKNTAKIAVVPGSATKEYDGKALTKTETADFTVTGVPEGFSWTAAADGTVTNVKPGAGEKAVNAVSEFKIFNAANEDVTDQFANIDKSATGKLEITPKAVTLTSGDAEKQYDGTALTNEGVEGKNANGLTVEEGWVDGEGATYTFTGSQTERGESANAFSYTLKAGTLADNYTITKTEGKLSVYGAALSITKTAAPASVTAAGDKITYTVTVKNEGNVNVKDGKLADDHADLSAETFKLAPGEEATFTYTYEATQDDIDAGEIVNVVKANATAEYGKDPEEVSATATVTAKSSPSMVLEKKVTSEPANGHGYVLNEEITYTVTVTNDGNQTLHDINVEDELTDDAWTVDTLAPGESKTFETKPYIVTEDDVKAGSVLNVATASGYDPTDEPVDPDPDDEKVLTDKIAIEITAASDRKVYDATPLTNDGWELTDGELAEGHEISEVTVTGEQLLVGESANVASDAKIVNADGEDMNAYYEITYVDGTLTVTDGKQPDDEEEVPDELVVVKDDNNEKSYKVGETIVWTITVTNIYDDVKTLAVEELIEGAEFVDEVPETLEPGEKVELTVQYVVTAEDAAKGTITNTVKVTIGDLEKQGDDTVDVVPQYRLTVNYLYFETKETAAETFTKVYDEGDEYNVASPLITGYTPDQARVTGTITADTTIDVYYKVNTHTLTVRYVYVNGTEAAPEHTEVLEYNTDYSVPSPVIPGFTAQQVTLTGTMPDQDVTVTIMYFANVTPIVVIDDYDTPLGLPNLSLSSGEVYE